MNGNARCSRRLATLAGAVLLCGAACGISGRFGAEARLGCLLAIAVVGFSGICWLLQMLLAGRQWPKLLRTALSRGPWVRLRSTLAGIFLVGAWIEQELVWFLGWTSFFYVTVLAAETAVIVWLLREYNWNRSDVSAD